MLRLALTTGALLLALAAPAGAACPGAPWAEQRSGVAGSTVYRGGELIATDHIYDDHGASGGAPVTVADVAATAAGSYRYPLARTEQLNNGADLRELRFRIEGDRLAVQVGLNTLTQPDAAVVGVAFDLDRSGADGAPHAWPHDAGLATRGTDAVLTLWGTGADLVRADGGTTTLTEVCADVERNLIEARVPLSQLGDSTRWRVLAAAGVWAGGTWAQPEEATSPAAARAYDLAFVTGEGQAGLLPGVAGQNWFDARQAASLATGEISSYAATVDLELLRAKADRPWAPQPGYHEVVYRSSTTLPPNHEGWQPLGPLEGPWQAYSMYVPRDLPEQPGLFAFFHGVTRNHTHLSAGVNMQSQLGDGLGLVLVGSLGRGGNGGAANAAGAAGEGYRGAGFLDVREMLADVRERMHVDQRRQFAGAYSMGGIAAYQLLSFYPDEFAGAVIWAGTKPGDTDAWLAGARWVPALFVHAPTDEVVTYEWSLTSARTLEGYGYEVELASPAGEHEYQAVTDDYRLPVDWFQGRRSVVDPPRVTYTRYPALDRPELGLKADGAYWVDDVAATGAIGTIDVTSSALAKTLPGTAPIGPETTDGPLGPVLLTGQRYTWPGTPVPVANALQAKLTGVSGFTIDAARAGLDPTAALRITVESDGPATVTLRGGCVERLTFPAGATEQTVPACAKPLGLPSTKRCASRRHFLIRLPRGKLRSVVVSVNGKRARVLRGRRVRSRVDLRGLPAGRVTVTIRARTRAGRLIRQTRRYLTCAR